MPVVNRPAPQEAPNNARVAYLAALLDDALLTKRLSSPRQDELTEVYLDNALSYAEEAGLAVESLKEAVTTALQAPAGIAATL